MIQNFKGYTSFIIIILYWLYPLYYILIAYYTPNGLYSPLPQPYLAPPRSGNY